MSKKKIVIVGVGSHSRSQLVEHLMDQLNLQSHIVVVSGGREVGKHAALEEFLKQQQDSLSHSVKISPMLKEHIIDWSSIMKTVNPNKERTEESYSDCFTRRFTAPYKRDMNDGGRLKRVGDYIDVVSKKTYTEEQILSLHRDVTKTLQQLDLSMSEIDPMFLNDIIKGLENE